MKFPVKIKIPEKLKKTGEKLTGSALAIYILLAVVAAGVLGFLLRCIIGSVAGLVNGEGFRVRLIYLIQWQTWAIGLFIVLVFFAVSAISGGFRTLG